MNKKKCLTVIAGSLLIVGLLARRSAAALAVQDGCACAPRW